MTEDLPNLVQMASKILSCHTFMATLIREPLLPMWPRGTGGHCESLAKDLLAPRFSAPAPGTPLSGGEPAAQGKGPGKGAFQPPPTRPPFLPVPRGVALGML